MASHSSCRAICNHPRNMSDDMIRALAAKGGVIQINYDKTFLDQTFKDRRVKLGADVVQTLAASTSKCGDDPECVMLQENRHDRELTASGQVAAR